MKFNQSMLRVFIGISVKGGDNDEVSHSVIGGESEFRTKKETVVSNINRPIVHKN
jgi:hypothetical protein